MGWDSLLVLTGVTGLEELVRARKEERPTYIAPDLAALAEPQQAPEAVDGGVTLGGWTATVDGRPARGRRATGRRTTGGGSWRSRPGVISTRRGSLSRPMACSLPSSVSAMSESFVNPIFGGHDEPATVAELEDAGNERGPGTPTSTRSSHRWRRSTTCRSPSTWPSSSRRTSRCGVPSPAPARTPGSRPELSRAASAPAARRRAGASRPGSLARARQRADRRRPGQRQQGGRHQAGHRR